MKKVLIATAVAIALTGINAKYAQAQTNNSEQTAPVSVKADNTQRDLIGFGAGATTGALVGGPIGSVIGAILGILISNDMNQHDALEHSEYQLLSANQALTTQQNDFLALQRQYVELEQSQMMQLASFDTKAATEWMYDLPSLESNVQFKTASFDIEDTFKGQLNSMAGLLNQYPSLKVQLTGFADIRGDSQYNKALSQQRADSVKSYLLKQNVDPSQIFTLAQGEQASFAELTNAENADLGNAGYTSHEALFFDRRVTVKLLTKKASLSASN
ncbi:sortase-associated OmpA-like protein PdsO [Glaciecola sp. XM2]|uniref:sortase-associated OmpA-like protein PdsO n=1 Tax=Glaciecola sp. XM2 TaxID=1914931 RepID=UPI001BDDD10F|nr:sortase-associated OmpA-like protein PdsO [Glaciecola sp. XM2]MBT1451062.1 sortase-associated OmpA-like protein PdsO [Glaciecola sp. XM2]